MYPYVNFFALHIPSYGLCVCIAMFLCAMLAFRRAKKIGLDFNDLLITGAVAIGCGTLGGMILYIAVSYDFETICKQIVSMEFSFLKNPGIVFYGGLIGAIIGVVVTVRLLKVKAEDVEHCIVPYIPLGHAVGRVGCLLTGCCYGFQYKGIFAVATRFGDEGESQLCHEKFIDKNWRIKWLKSLE